MGFRFDMTLLMILLIGILPTGLFIISQSDAVSAMFYELHSVEVTDETDAVHRIIEVDRTIYLNFYGEWETEEQLLLNGGGFTTVRECTGDANYRTDKGLPSPLWLDWWNGDSCEFTHPHNEFPDGLYRLCTWVQPWLGFLPLKKVGTCSKETYRKPIP